MVTSTNCLRTWCTSYLAILYINFMSCNAPSPFVSPKLHPVWQHLVYTQNHSLLGSLVFTALLAPATPSFLYYRVSYLLTIDMQIKLQTMKRFLTMARQQSRHQYIIRPTSGQQWCNKLVDARLTQLWAHQWVF